MKKNRIVALFAVSALMLALFIYYDKMLVSKNIQTGQEPQETHTEGTGGGNLPAPDETADEALAGANTGVLGIDTGNAGGYDGQLMECEKVHVDGNTPEYEFMLELCEDMGGRTFIRMEYYLDGSSVVNELDEGKLTELDGIFEKRRQENGGSFGFKIGQALLNPVTGQLYLLINGTAADDYVQASLYKINVRDLSVRKLFSYPALYGKMSLSDDCSLLAYSYKNPAAMSFYQEDYILDVYDCKNDEYLVRGNRGTDGEYIGSNSIPDLLYDYEFIEWRPGGLMKLKQGTRQKSGLNGKPQWEDVMYDIQKNLLLDMDGNFKEYSGENGVASSIAFEPEGNGTGDNEAQGADTSGKSMPESTKGSVDTGAGPEIVVENFYSYLRSEDNYAKAMRLLDDG
ncbi:MAG: hypothetical protein ACM3XR_12160, partial [Bacillota bacterium]